ncbi:MAG: trehalose-phosphatase [Candidatus Binataceae bacterium]|nr:trehalose-phosphatase [Candidatus Binataceae bacterium]
MMDYDGTLAPIVNDPAVAWPLPEARKALMALASRPDLIDLAVVSGRNLIELRRLLNLDRGLYLIGVHGLEMANPDGKVEILPDLQAAMIDLAEVRRWLRNIPNETGLIVEDKVLSLALHYRNADLVSARSIVAEFESFVAGFASRLAIKRGKKVIEAVPLAANKGAAVTRLIELTGNSAIPIYLGDDVTDEDAFRALAGRGVTILVGEARESAAQYRVDSPAEVARLLAELVAPVDSRGAPVDRQD